VGYRQFACDDTETYPDWIFIFQLCETIDFDEAFLMIRGNVRAI